MLKYKSSKITNTQKSMYDKGKDKIDNLAQQGVLINRFSIMYLWCVGYLSLKYYNRKRMGEK